MIQIVSYCMLAMSPGWAILGLSNDPSKCRGCYMTTQQEWNAAASRYPFRWKYRGDREVCAVLRPRAE